MVLEDFYTVFSDAQGSGYIFDNETDILEFIDPIDVIIGNETLRPGDMTTLNNYFTKKAKYLGVVKENGMIFFYGTDRNLFPKSYYGIIYRLSKDRIFEMFSHKGGRDHNFKNGFWK